MKFRTEIQVPKYHETIQSGDSIFCMGSCFAEEMGKNLTDYKFDVLSNPFGTLYNPDSIFTLLKAGYRGSHPGPERIIVNDGVYVSLDYHSELSALRKDLLQSLIDDRLQQTKQHLSKSKWLILTFGSAFRYRLKSDNKVVANCHKQPAIDFEKELMSLEEMEKGFTEVLQVIPNGTNIIVTVSPVRHIKDTLQLNSVSKSILRLFCHQISTSHKHVTYFPSYEMMMDDLRDYRFYQSDLLHPSESAVQYIWLKFLDAYLSEEARDFVASWKSILERINHRPGHVQSEGHQKFLQKTIELLTRLKGKVDIENELQRLQEQLNDTE